MSAGRPVYLYHNATTPILPEVVDAMPPYLREHHGNPSSGHAYGWLAHEAVERARRQVAALIGCDQDEVIFTSGGTESNNLAIRGTLGHAVNDTTSSRPPSSTRQRRVPARGWNVTACASRGSPSI